MKYQITMWRQLGLTGEDLRLCLRQKQKSIHNGRVRDVGRPAMLDYEAMQTRFHRLSASLADQLPDMIRAYAPGSDDA